MSALRASARPVKRGLSFDSAHDPELAEGLRIALSARRRVNLEQGVFYAAPKLWLQIVAAKAHIS